MTTKKQKLNPAALTLLECVADDGGAFALARYISDQPVHDRMLVRIRSDGTYAAAGKTLPLGLWWSTCGLVGDGQGKLLVAASERLPTPPLYTRLVWFAAEWTGRSLKWDRLGHWDDVNFDVHNVRGQRFGKTVLWAGSYFSDITQGRDTCLVLGKGAISALPQAFPTQIQCSETSQPVGVGRERFLLISSGYQSIELWSVTDCQAPTRIATVAKCGGQKKAFCPQLIRSHNALILIWCEYQRKPRLKSRPTYQDLGSAHVTKLFAREFDTKQRQLGEPILVTDDTHMVGTTLQTHPLRDLTLITWETRSKRRSGYSAVRLRNLDELPRTPSAIEATDRLFVIDAEGSSILGVLFNAKTNGWRVDCDLSAIA